MLYHAPTKQIRFYGSLDTSLIDLMTPGLAFSSHKYAWLGIDWTLISCLGKMGVAKPYWFSQVNNYLTSSTSVLANSTLFRTSSTIKVSLQVLLHCQCFKAPTTPYNQIFTPAKSQISSPWKLQLFEQSTIYLQFVCNFVCYSRCYCIGIIHSN